MLDNGKYHIAFFCFCADPLCSSCLWLLMSDSQCWRGWLNEWLTLHDAGEGRKRVKLLESSELSESNMWFVFTGKGSGDEDSDKEWVVLQHSLFKFSSLFLSASASWFSASSFSAVIFSSLSISSVLKELAFSKYVQKRLAWIQWMKDQNWNLTLRMLF